MDGNIFNAFIGFVHLKLSPNSLNKCKQTVFGWTDLNLNKNCFFYSNDGAFEEVNFCPENFSLAFSVYKLTSATGKPVLFLTNVSFDSNGSSVGVDPVSPTPIAASILYNIAATWEQVSPI